MFDIGPEKIAVVLVVALLVLGPGRLAEAARALGRARAQLRQLSSELPPDTVKLIRDPSRAVLDVLAPTRQAIADAAAGARESVIPTTEEERGEGTR
jgi:sec-independent protein translocase protein TatA